MAWNDPDGNDRDPWGGRKGDDGPPDLDEVVRKMQDKLGGLFGGRGGGGEMQMGQFGDGVTDAFVNVAGYLAALGVGQGNVHIAGGHRRRHGFKPVGHGQGNIGFNVLKLSGQFHDRHAGGFGHGGGGFAFDDGIHRGGGFEAIGAY